MGLLLGCVMGKSTALTRKQCLFSYVVIEDQSSPYPLLSHSLEGKVRVWDDVLARIINCEGIECI